VVGFVHNLNLAQAAFALGGLFGQNVIGVGLCEGEFAGPGFLEPFGGAPVRLDLWHNMNSWRFVLRLKYGEALKSQKPDGFEKSSIYGAQISRSEAYLCTPQRLRDAAQRRKWTFCGTVKHRWRGRQVLIARATCCNNLAAVFA
jgi:hypothetical protein